MKKIIFGIAMLFSAAAVNAQNGLESIIVEKYYVSNAADATGSVGALPTGSVTYRFYVDMLPGYKFQVAYGTSTHSLSFNTTTTFFNNEDRGAANPTFTKTQARANSVMLDSWLSVGAACAANYGVLKTEDDGVATVVNSNSPQILQNNNVSAGIPLFTQDGLLAGTPSAVTTVGQVDAQAALVFDATSQAGNSFTLTDGAWASLAGTQGPTSTNRILIAQITTNGVLSYALNIQIGTPTGGVQNFVSSAPTGSEVLIPSLTGILGAPNTLPTVSITSPTNGSAFITGSTISIAATAADANGTVSSVEFFKNGVSISTDNTSPYAASYTAALGTDVLTAVATDNDGGTTTSTAVTITVANNPPPTVSITSPAAATSYVTGDVVTITATASDNGSVASVEFFVDGNLISTDITSPYAATYTSTLGSHALTARATDNAGLTTTTAATGIVVVNNLPPTVSLTSPLAGALFTAPAVVTLSANAADSDGSIAQVEFFVNAVSVGVDASSPYSFNWTSVIGSASIVAKATDNRGALTSSSAIVLNIADPNGLPYNIGSSVNVCNQNSFCLPLNVFTPVANVIGYDVVMNYDVTAVTPTGVVTVAPDLINPSLVDVSAVVNTPGVINISVYFNSSAPASTRFTGSGRLFCVEFNKNVAFAPVDTAAFTVPFLQESYFTGVQPKLVQNGNYISYRDTVYTGTTKLWTNNSVIPYNSANPNQFLVTNVRGTNASCANISTTAVQPNLNGVFTYSSNNGLSINIDKDIIGTTDVQAVINGADALLVRRVLANDPTFVPSVYQIVAMDVNLDGVVSAGDNSQINQRAVLIIPEFKQDWNYSIAGVSDGRASKDWLFTDSTTVNSSAAFTISSTYPNDNGTGFSKSRVPNVDFCLPIKVTSYATCPVYSAETYVGILMGDINGNVATANPSSGFKSLTEKVIFDLNNAIYTSNTVEIPVTVMSNDVVNSIDFSMMFDENKMNFAGVTSVSSSLQSMNYFNTEDRTLRFTANGFDNINNSNPVAFVKFNVNAPIKSKDLANLFAYLNGEQAEVEVIGLNVTGISNVASDLVAVFPNPANTFVNVISPEASNVQLLDAAGRVVSSTVSIPAGQTHTISTSEIASGIYFVKISNDNFTTMKRIVISK